MAQFDLKAFMALCEATMSQFKREEKRDRWENALLFRTPRQINEEFKRGLDEIKKEVGLIPTELYISTRPDGTQSVELGATLLEMEVVFHVSIDIRRVSQKFKKKGQFFCFERKVADEYDRCVRHYREIKQEIGQSWPAGTVSYSELLCAITSVEEERRQAFAQLLAYRRNNGPLDAQKKLAMKVGNLDFLLSRLRKLSSRRV